MKAKTLPKKPTKRQVEAALSHANPKIVIVRTDYKHLDSYKSSFTSDMGKAAEILRAHILHERAKLTKQ